MTALVISDDGTEVVEEFSEQRGIGCRVGLKEKFTED